jgi:hypothetical protein|tara:strand:+ start:577 stop:750 length:174 start_codon:yes stop_codon:yes gene_type:complete
MSNTQEVNKNPFLTQKTASNNGRTCRKAESLADMFDENGNPLNRKARRMLKKIKKSL